MLKLKKPVMTFNQFAKWCSARADVEGIYEGTVCAINDIINYDRKVKKGEFE